MGLKKLRELRGMNQRELVQVSGVGQGLLSNIERGYTKRVRRKTLKKIAGALNITPERLEVETGINCEEKENKKIRGKKFKDIVEGMSSIEEGIELVERKKKEVNEKQGRVNAARKRESTRLADLAMKRELMIEGLRVKAELALKRAKEDTAGELSRKTCGIGINDLRLIAGRKITQEEYEEIGGLLRDLRRDPDKFTGFSAIIKHKPIIDKLNDARKLIIQTVVGDRMLQILNNLNPEEIAVMRPEERRRWLQALAMQSRAYNDMPLVSLNINMNTKKDVADRRTHLYKLLTQPNADVVDLPGEGSMADTRRPEEIVEDAEFEEINNDNGTCETDPNA